MTHHNNNHVDCDHDADAVVAIRTVSPAQVLKRMLLKREREQNDEEEEEPTRSVKQRTDNTIDTTTPRSMKQVFLSSMRSDDEYILVQGLKDLNTLLLNDDDDTFACNQGEFYTLGGHAVVLNVMAKHPNCSDVQYHGMQLVANAVCRNNDLTVAAFKLNAIQTFLAAMDKYHSDFWIQDCGMAAIVNLLWSDDHCLEENVKHLADEQGGISTILSAMERFATVESIAEYGCIIFYTLSRVKELRKRVFKANVVASIVKARNKYSENELIREYVGNALEVLTEYAKSG